MRNCIRAGYRTGGFRSRRLYNGFDLRDGRHGRSGYRATLARCLARAFAGARARVVAAQVRQYVTELEVRAFLGLPRRLAPIVGDTPPIVGLTPDPGDDDLVVLARASGVQTPISGDRHLCDLVDPVPPVLTPREFLDRLAS